MRRFSLVLLASTILTSAFAVAARAQVPTSPPVGFANSTSPGTGTVITNVLDSYATLLTSNPGVLTQNFQDVVTLTQNRTAAQTLAAVHDDRTNQQYSVTNGLGALTSLFLTGAGASASGITPNSLTPTSYAPASLADFAANINYLNNASWGATTFGNGTATPLAGAVNFVNNVVRANSSTEPPKRAFERYQGPNPPINPLAPQYANYSATTNQGALTTADTAAFVVPSYLSNFTVPKPYADTSQWVKGFTVTPAMIAANGGNPITAPNLGTFDSAGNFTPATFAAGAYVPGIGTAPRPYRVSTDVVVPDLLKKVINSTNPYADGAFPSGHTNSGETQAIGMAFLVPQQMQELLIRASDLGNNRILAGMHSPLDVIGGRIEGTAIAATNIYGALYDKNGNRLDWTNPANASAYAVYQALNQTQTYLASACGTASVTGCVQQAQASGATASDPLAPTSANQALYRSRLTYGFAQSGSNNAPLTDAQVPVQAQVLLLTRLPYLTDAQRTDVLATTSIQSGYPVTSGNTWDGWGQLDLVRAANGYGAFNGRVTVSMDASQGGYSAADTWSNDIGGAGGLVKQGTGTLTLSGANSYTGGTEVDAGRLVAASGSALGTGDTTVKGGTLVDAAPGRLTVGGNYTQGPDGTLEIDYAGPGDQELRIDGLATIDGHLLLDFLGALPLYTTETFTLDALGGLIGDFSSIDFAGLIGPYTDTITRTADGLTITVSEVPEPAIPAALALALAVTASVVGRRRSVKG